MITLITLCVQTQRLSINEYSYRSWQALLSTHHSSQWQLMRRPDTSCLCLLLNSHGKLKWFKQTENLSDEDSFTLHDSQWRWWREAGVHKHQLSKLRVNASLNSQFVHPQPHVLTPRQCRNGLLDSAPSAGSHLTNQLPYRRAGAGAGAGHRGADIDQIVHLTFVHGITVWCGHWPRHARLSHQWPGLRPAGY